MVGGAARPPPIHPLSGPATGPRSGSPLLRRGTLRFFVGDIARAARANHLGGPRWPPPPRSATSILPLSVPIHATVLISTGRAGASIDQPSSRATTAWGRLLGGGGTGLSQPTGHASLSGRGRDRWAIRRSKPENLTWNDERGHEPLRFPVVIGIQRPTDGSSEEQAGAMTGRRASRISLPVSRSITGCAGGRSRTIGFPRAFRDGGGAYVVQSDPVTWNRAYVPDYIYILSSHRCAHWSGGSGAGHRANRPSGASRRVRRIRRMRHAARTDLSVQSAPDGAGRHPAGAMAGPTPSAYSFLVSETAMGDPGLL
jgi:hypothetical protein